MIGSRVEPQLCVGGCGEVGHTAMLAGDERRGLYARLKGSDVSARWCVGVDRSWLVWTVLIGGRGIPPCDTLCSSGAEKHTAHHAKPRRQSAAGPHRATIRHYSTTGADTHRGATDNSNQTTASGDSDVGTCMSCCSNRVTSPPTTCRHRRRTSAAGKGWLAWGHRSNS